jgi:S1 RNA binding domain protein
LFQKIALSIKKAMEQDQQAAGGKNGFDGPKPQRPRTPRPAPAPRYNSLDFAQKHKDEPKSFEDMMAKFKQTSDDKMSDLKHNIDNKRGGGRRGYSK